MQRNCEICKKPVEQRRIGRVKRFCDACYQIRRRQHDAEYRAHTRAVARAKNPTGFWLELSDRRDIKRHKFYILTLATHNTACQIGGDIEGHKSTREAIEAAFTWASVLGCEVDDLTSQQILTPGAQKAFTTQSSVTITQMTG